MYFITTRRVIEETNNVCKNETCEYEPRPGTNYIRVRMRTPALSSPYGKDTGRLYNTLFAEKVHVMNAVTRCTYVYTHVYDTKEYMTTHIH
jgi:hypothetical protein